MTVAELRKVLLNMDQKAEVYIADPTHFMRKHKLARIEETYIDSFDKPPVLLIAKDS